MLPAPFRPEAWGQDTGLASQGGVPETVGHPERGASSLDPGWERDRWGAGEHPQCTGCGGKS